jgi:8-oxo-dGTP diphosphatase
MERGETPEECAVREVWEESGLRPTVLQLKGFLTFPDFANNEDWYAFVFAVPEFEGELIDSPEGELRWVDDDQLLSLNLWEGDLIFLPWLDKPGFFSGKFVYKHGRLTEHEAAFY